VITRLPLEPEAQNTHTPTVHEPCLYSGTINGVHIIFMRQVDDFAIAAPDQRTADILLDMLDEKLSMPVKRLLEGECPSVSLPTIKV